MTPAGEAARTLPACGDTESQGPPAAVRAVAVNSNVPSPAFDTVSRCDCGDPVRGNENERLRESSANEAPAPALTVNVASTEMEDGAASGALTMMLAR